MPPKKLKDLSSAPVYTMPHEQQVRLLSDALLREYMHRRGYQGTLKAFDEENPRDAETISSRALMADLMALASGDQQRLKADGIETIMEMLCDLRVEKRREVEQLTRDARAEPVAAPTEADLERLRDEVAQQRKLFEQRRSLSQTVSSSGARAPRRRSKGSDDEGGDDSGEDRRTQGDQGERKRRKKGKKHSKGSSSGRGGKSRGSSSDRHGDGFDPVAGGVDGCLTLDDLLGGSTRSNSSSSGGGSEGGDDNRLGTRSSTTAVTASAATAAAAGGQTAKGRQPPPPPPAPAANHAGLSGAGKGGGEDDEGSDDGSDTGSEGSVGGAGGGIDGGAPLDPALAEDVCRLLYGRSPSESPPPLSFLQQGFVFDDSALDYALVQWRRGPGAVIAAVQSLVLTYYYEKEVYVNARTRQRDCLRRALSTILFRAQPSPSSIVLVNGPLGLRNPRKSFAARVCPSPPTPSLFHVWSAFTSTEEVEEALGEFLASDEEQWLSPKGSGLWCFLMSVCLSRGTEAIRKDLATGGHGRGSRAAVCLIDPATGDGRPELAHLMLTGRATPHPQPRGVGPLPSGLLDGDSRAPGSGGGGDEEEEAKAPTWRGAEALLSPGYPSWVVHHGGHYGNLFMRRDTRKAFRQKTALSGAASAELFYWDPLTEDEEYALGVEVASALEAHTSRRKIEPSTRSATSYVTIAIQSVPDWKRATVDWKGETPLK